MTDCLSTSTDKDDKKEKIIYLYNCINQLGVLGSLGSLKGQFRINPSHITFTSAVSVQIMLFN